MHTIEEYIEILLTRNHDLFIELQKLWQDPECLLDKYDAFAIKHCKSFLNGYLSLQKSPNIENALKFITNAEPTRAYIVEESISKYPDQVTDDYYKICIRNTLEWLDIDDDEVMELVLSSEYSNVFDVIIYCMISPDQSLLRSLLSKGCDSNIRDNSQFGNTPLMWAIANAAHIEAINLLKCLKKLNIQTDLNVPSEFLGNTPLILSVAKGHPSSRAENTFISNYEITKLLLEQGADANVVDNMGYSALHIACMRRDYDTIALLMRHGANATLLNEKGQTPKDFLTLSYEESITLLTYRVTGFEGREQTYDSYLTLDRDRYTSTDIETLTTLLLVEEKQELTQSSSSLFANDVGKFSKGKVTYEEKSDGQHKAHRRKK